MNHKIIFSTLVFIYGCQFGIDVPQAPTDASSTTADGQIDLQDTTEPLDANLDSSVVTEMNPGETDHGSLDASVLNNSEDQTQNTDDEITESEEQSEESEQPQESTTIGTGKILITEFRLRGPAGGNDEFIEIKNVGDGAINIGGWILMGASNSGTTRLRATIAESTVLAPGEYFLIAHTGFSQTSDAVTVDLTYSLGISDDGGFAIYDDEGTLIDSVGMSTECGLYEGTPLTPLVDNVDRRYIRIRNEDDQIVDTDNNLSDFMLVEQSTTTTDASPQ